LSKTRPLIAKIEKRDEWPVASKKTGASNLIKDEMVP
jgi:hypothetical protein